MNPGPHVAPDAVPDYLRMRAMYLNCTDGQRPLARGLSPESAQDHRSPPRKASLSAARGPTLPRVPHREAETCMSHREVQGECKSPCEVPGTALAPTPVPPPEPAMDQCVTVEWELEKVRHKFSGYGQHSERSLEELIDYTSGLCREILQTASESCLRAAAATPPSPLPEHREPGALKAQVSSSEICTARAS
ncbi:hypothetical protein NDU88_003608 [Pleurodeles waltl]|uniref:Uncharacterized protein n=1 Tax=Pleurodeles waltl TaxID=8319 RepID=A0AAV7VDW8_PLEWA|nr:hypothetical protein NDU88_003608 [Pleurodeles waltl]